MYHKFRPLLYCLGSYSIKLWAWGEYGLSYIYLLTWRRMSKHTCIKHITSVINCGYARVAIRSLSKPNHGGAGINKAERMEMFRRQFKSVPSYFPDPSIFESSSSSESAFDRGCKKILTQFSQKWHPTESRCSYTATFSVENWKQLPNKYKQTHTMSNCQGCLLEHPTMQTKFPGHTIIPIDRSHLLWFSSRGRS